MTQALDDAREVHAKTHEWINGLATAGIAPGVTLIAAYQALNERMLIEAGVEPTKAWLRKQADQLDEHGEELLAALKAERR